MRARIIRQLLDAVGFDTIRVPDLLPALRRDGQLGHDAIWHLRTRFTHPRMGTIATTTAFQKRPGYLVVLARLIRSLPPSQFLN